MPRPLLPGCNNTFQVTKRSSTGLLAAAFTAIVPSYISRSVGGSYDNEGVAIFALVFVFYLWIKSVNTGSMMWACLTVSERGVRLAKLRSLPGGAGRFLPLCRPRTAKRNRFSVVKRTTPAIKQLVP